MVRNIPTLFLVAGVWALAGPGAAQEPASKPDNEKTLTLSGRGGGPIRVVEPDGTETVLEQGRVRPVMQVDPDRLPRTYGMPVEPEEPEEGAERRESQKAPEGEPAAEEPTAETPKETKPAAAEEPEELTEEDKAVIERLVGRSIKQQTTPVLPESARKRMERTAKDRIPRSDSPLNYETFVSSPRPEGVDTTDLSEKELELQQFMQQNAEYQATPQLPESVLNRTKRSAQSITPRATSPADVRNPAATRQAPTAPALTPEDRRLQQQVIQEWTKAVVPTLPESVRKRKERRNTFVVEREGSVRNADVPIPPHLWQPPQGGNN